MSRRPYLNVERRDRLAGGPGSALGTSAKLTSAPVKTGRPLSDAARQGPEVSPVVRRFALQAGARELLRGVQRKGEAIWQDGQEVRRPHRTCSCLRRPVDEGEGIPVLYHPQHGRASYANLQTCASVWACPVCAAKITERRRQEVRRAVEFARSQGWRVLLVTRTISHYSFENVQALLALLKKALKHLNGGRKAKDRRERWPIMGTIRALEETYGNNGWHPHYHELVFVEGGVDLGELERQWKADWSASVAHAGGRPLHGVHGLDVTDCNAKISDYLAKWGTEPAWQEDAELTKSPAKLGKHAGHFSPLELLSKFTFEGDVQAGSLWKEYALSMHGSHQLQWSRGLKKLCGVEEMTDAEVEQTQDAAAVRLAEIPLSEWRLVLRAEERGAVLEAASSGDMGSVMAVLERVSAEWGSGRTARELAADERASVGWSVAAKSRRQAADATICHRADRILDTVRAFGVSRDEASKMLAHSDRVRRESRTACLFTRKLYNRQV